VEGLGLVEVRKKYPNNSREKEMQNSSRFP
jgi:hypothetical protein